jgi:hypothetical protein
MEQLELRAVSLITELVRHHESSHKPGMSSPRYIPNNLLRADTNLHLVKCRSKSLLCEHLPAIGTKAVVPVGRFAIGSPR